MHLTPISLTGMTPATQDLGSEPFKGGGAPFSHLMRDAIQNVSDLQQNASSTVEGMLRGDGVDIHQAMIATQKADTAFELALSVRNKAVGAYQQMMNMQF